MLQKRGLTAWLRWVVARTLLPILLGTLTATATSADTSKVTIGSGFGIHYLPFYVMERAAHPSTMRSSLAPSILSVQAWDLSRFFGTKPART